MKRPLLGTVVLGLGGILVGSSVARAEDAPVAAAPAKLDATPSAAAAADAAPAAKAHSAGAGGVGLSPNTPQITGGTNLTAKEAESLTPTTTSAGADEWKFDFHGYMRGPMRVSWGPPSPGVQPPNAVTPLGLTDPPSGTQLHGFPRVPGANYVTWDYTNTVPGPWAQLNFSYGNSRAMMTVIVDSYSQTSGGYRNVQAQQGIDQAFVTLNFPEAFGDRGGLVWNVGSFQNRYGTAGKYDGGMYETYLFGRTHVGGSTWTENIDATPEIGVTLEEGIGAKMDVVPFTSNQLFQIFKGQAGGNTVGTNQGFGYQTYLSDRDAEFLPYAGPVPQGSTFLAHMHAAASYRKMWTLSGHLIYTWTPDDNWSGTPATTAGGSTAPGNSQQPNVSDKVPRYLGPTKGSMLITGGDLRLNGGVYGDGYIGVSYIDAKNIDALADAVEVLHSFGGWQFKANFFGVSFNPHTGYYLGPQNESGTVTTIEGQYTFSFGALAHYPAAFWGDGPDLAITLFGMLSIVKSPPPVIPGSPANSDWNMDDKKLKFGTDVMYTPLPWFGVGGRFDVVEPDLDAKGMQGGSHANFEVFSPRIVFKTHFVTHEAITINYQRFFVGSEVYPIYPYQWVAKPDLNLFSIAGTMWW